MLSTSSCLQGLVNILAFRTHGKLLWVPVGYPLFATQSLDGLAAYSRSSHISFVDVVSEAFVVALIKMTLGSLSKGGALVHLNLSLLVRSHYVWCSGKRVEKLGAKWLNGLRASTQRQAG